MSKVKFELNSAGVRELLRSPEMLSICKEKADHAEAQLGAGFEVTTHVGKNRCNAMIAAVTFKAKKENADTNCILKAVRG